MTSEQWVGFLWNSRRKSSTNDDITSHDNEGLVDFNAVIPILTPLKRFFRTTLNFMKSILNRVWFSAQKQTVHKKMFFMSFFFLPTEYCVLFRWFFRWLKKLNKVNKYDQTCYIFFNTSDLSFLCSALLCVWSAIKLSSIWHKSYAFPFLYRVWLGIVPFSAFANLELRQIQIFFTEKRTQN